MSWAWNPGQRSLKVIESGTIRYIGYGFLLVCPYDAPFLRYSTCNYTVTLKPGLGVIKVIGTDTDRSATYDFLLMFHSNNGPVFTVSGINGDFSRKSQKFPTSVYFAPLLKGFPLELGTYGRGPKKLEWWRYRAEKEVCRYLQPSGYKAPTWQTDGRTDTDRRTAGDSKDRAYA